MNKDTLRNIINNYLVDDGLDKDIVVLAKQMGIDVYYQHFSEDEVYNDKDFVAFTYIDDDRKIICINSKCVNNGDLSRFIVAYQLAEYINSDKMNFKSFYKIDMMDMDNYMLAKKIVDRSYKYKKNKFKNKILKLFRDN